MIIRLARAADEAALRSLIERAYTTYVERIGRRPAPMDDDYMDKIRRREVYVADDGEVAGVVVLVEAADQLLIETVAVDPPRQHRGIGRELLAFAESLARDHALKEVSLYTNEAMTENLAFYPKYGFCEIDRRVEDGFRRVFFSKTVGEEWKGACRRG